MVVSCKIEFDQNSAGIYLAGQYVSGTVTLTSDKPKSVKGVLLKINGYAYTTWQHSTANAPRKDGVVKSNVNEYRGQEDYIAFTTYILESENDESIDIMPGLHTYNFGCNLPKTCPSSFEGGFGHVRYTVEVVFLRPWKFDQTFTKAFTVLKMLDLNYDSPKLRTTVDEKIQSSSCCDLCVSEPIKLHLNLPQSGYVSGQNIPVTLIVTNDSDLLVKEMEISLKMIVCYFSNNTTRAEKERIFVTKQKGEPIQRYCKKLFNYLLYVPATPPTCRTGLIQIAYQVEAEAKIQGWQANEVICVPVTIGNVPLSDVISQQPTISLERKSHNTPPKGVVPNGSKMDTASSSMTIEGSWADDDNIPLPSYETADHMISVKVNTNEPYNYEPKYPVFEIASPAIPTSIEIERNNNKQSKLMLTIETIADALPD